MLRDIIVVVVRTNSSVRYEHIHGVLELGSRREEEGEKWKKALNAGRGGRSGEGLCKDNRFL